jgi:hypothetical protein
VEVSLWLIALAGVSFAIGFAIGAQGVKDEAIRHGSAMESVDPESGEMRFEWK